MKRSFKDYILAPELQALVASHRLPAVSYFEAWAKLVQEDTLRAAENLKRSIATFEASGSQTDYAEFQFDLRVLVRAFFAQIEGVCAAMARLSVYAYERKEVEFSEKKLDQLKNGHRFRTLENVKLAFRAYAASFEIEYRGRTGGGTGWDEFKKLIKVRNGITHPKTEDDYLVSESTLKIVRPGMLWFPFALEDLILRIKTQIKDRPDLGAGLSLEVAMKATKAVARTPEGARRLREIQNTLKGQ